MGPGVIDPLLRADREVSAEDQMREIYALPKTFDGSGAGLEGGARKDQQETPVPRLLPGEKETDRG